MKTTLFLFIALIFTANVFGQSLSKVGMQTRGFVDEERKNWTNSELPRPVFTVLWYPASAEAKEERIVIGNPEKPIFISGEAARNAGISPAKRRFPLVVLSHGTGGSALQLMWLGQFLAARGFIVAAVNHHGNTGAEDKYQAQGFVLWWERARDLTVAIDKLLADPEFGKHIDSKKIAAAGFSIGGATVTAVGGGIFNVKQFEKFCASPERDANCEPQPEYAGAMKEFEQLKTKDEIVIESLKRAETSYKDPRIKAVFAIAPALGASFTQKSLSSIKIPFRFVVGESDATAPAKTNAEKLARFIKNSNVAVLPGVGHYTFLSECSESGGKPLPFCRDAESVDRAEIHQKVSRMAFEFFEKNL